MENTKRNSHNQIENCPCYPRCDEMMSNPSQNWNKEVPFWPPLSSEQIPSYDPRENPGRMNAGMQNNSGGGNFYGNENGRMEQEYKNPWSDGMVNSWNNMNVPSRNNWNKVRPGVGNFWNNENGMGEMPGGTGNTGMGNSWNSGNGMMEMPRGTGNTGMGNSWSNGNGMMEMPRGTGSAGMENSWNNGNGMMRISPNYYNQNEENSVPDRNEGSEMYPNMNNGMPMSSYQNIMPQSYNGEAADQVLDEQENERDMERMKNMYPDIAKLIQQYAEEVCDDMEYEGSPMFDEQPDKVRFQKIVKGIAEKMGDDYPVEEKADNDDLLAMNKESRRRYPPGQNWLNDFIEVMLYQEMFRRRCRHRGCRRW